jgi:hypothetical protein
MVLTTYESQARAIASLKQLNPERVKVSALQLHQGTLQRILLLAGDLHYITCDCTASWPQEVQVHK